MRRRPLPPSLATVRLLPSASRALSAAVAALVVLTALLPAAFALAGGALVGSIGGAVADGWSSPAGRRLLVAIAGVVAVFLVQQVSGPALRALAEGLGRRAEGALRLRVMAATLRPAGVAHLEDPEVVDRVSEAQTVGTGETTLRDATVGIAAVAAQNLAAVLSAVVLAAYRWWLAVVLLAVCTATTRVLAAQFRGTIAALRGNARRFRRSSYFRDLALEPGAAKELRLFGLAPWAVGRFTAQWQVAMEAFWRDRRKAQWIPPAGVLVLAVAQGGAYLLLARSAARGEITLGELTTFAGAVAGVAAVFTIGWDTVNIAYGCAPVPAALELEAAAAAPRFQLPGTGPADGLPASGISFEGVAFRYPGRQQPVFEGLDLEIPAGRSLAIVGPNGAGKTTLVKLLSRLHDPTAGRITVDGIDLTTVDAAAWQRRIAPIFQDFARYQLSVADNIGFGAVDGRHGDREAAAHRAGATEIIDRLPAGWDTVNIAYGCAPVPAALELEAVAAEPRFQLPGTGPADGLPASGISFEGVAFRYPGRQQPVFEGLDLEIPAGRSLAIVGPNGAGKTTLVKLLSRLHDPTAGRITVDGIDLTTVDAAAWQRRIAPIFQDFARYQLSVADNIGFGAVDGRHGDREAAAHRAGATEIIDRLPAGWDTVLSRRARGGVDLSGGEWQRVALARALLAVDAGASVLVLDEPTAALDVRAEAEFYDRFLDLTRGTTTIVISHRFSTVRRADRIAVIEGGAVIETGDHDSLVVAGGRYAQMFRLQAIHYAAPDQGPSGPAEREKQGPSGPAEREKQGPIEEPPAGG